MANSVFSLLHSTLPIGAAITAARRDAGLSASQIISPGQLAPYLKALPKTGNLAPPAVPVVNPPNWAGDSLVRWWNKTTASARLWRFQHSGATPHVVTGVTARVRDTGYKTHTVLSELKWGRLEGGSVVPEIRIMTVNGATLDLPLTPAYVHSKYHVISGWVGENAVPSHPLEAFLDHGLVIAFAYEIGGGKVRPYVPPATDVSEAALKRYLALGGGTGESAASRWYDLMCDGDFMAGPSLAKTTPGKTRRVGVYPPRVLVALSLGTTRERADFEPGGIVGMARLYPHVMVRSNLALKRIDAATKITRPEKTHVTDPGNGTVKGLCCGAHSEIKSLLVTDSNEDAWGPNDAFKPFWSGVFSYYQVDPESRFKGQRLHMVRRDRPLTRTEPNCGHRDLATTPEAFTSIQKRPRQGEFDNLHLAPRLQLKAAFVTYLTVGVWPPVNSQYDPISAGPMRLDQLAMAPFCSHDCLHMHWRWSPGGPRWIKGWGAGNSPYSVEAAPMIPMNHDLDMIINDRHAVTLVEHAFPTANLGDDRSKTMAADSVQTFFYPGMAYAQGIVTWRESIGSSLKAALANGRTGFTAWDFADGARNLMGIDHPPVLYWNFRYYAAHNGKGWEARPWIGSFSNRTIDITPAEVDRARHR